MQLFFLILAGLLTAVGLFCFLRFSKHSIPCRNAFSEKVERMFFDTGYAVCLLFGKKIHLSSEKRRMLQSLYPSADPEELKTAYLSSQLSRFLELILVMDLLCLFLMAGLDSVHTIPYQLERPAFEAGDRPVRIMVVSEDHDPTEVRLTVERQSPSAVQAEAILDDAEEQLRRKLEKLGTIHQNLQLPTEVGQVRVSYQASDKKDLDTSGWVRLRKEESLWENTFSALLSFEGWERTIDFSLIFDTRIPVNIEDQIEAYTAQEQGTQIVSLPRTLEIDGMEKEVTYETPNEARTFRIAAVGMFLMTLLAFPMGSEQLKEKQTKRKRALVQGYPMMVQKLTVFLSAGLSLSEAWSRTVAQADPAHPLTEEMNVTRLQMNNGIGLSEAMTRFSERVGERNLKKLANMLGRNIRRGDEYLLEHLREMNREAWEEHKKQVRIQSEEASTKLLFPMLLMLGAVLLIVLTPAVITMSG